MSTKMKPTLAEAMNPGFADDGVLSSSSDDEVSRMEAELNKARTLLGSMLSKYSGLSQYSTPKQFRELNNDLMQLNQALEDVMFGSTGGRVAT